MDTPERESIEFDVVIVGAGPSGLSAACQIKKQAAEQGKEVNVCVLEKGAEVGAHIFSGAVIETKALDELFPTWKEDGFALGQPVAKDEVYLLRDESRATELPHWAVPPSMHNDNNYIVSVANLCRWLAEQAEELGVEIFPGFTAADVIFDDNGKVCGVATGDMGVGADGEPGPGYTPGMDILAKYTILGEGCRGHIGKGIIKKFALDSDADPQHYGIGFKEIWQVPESQHKPGLVVHGSGWPLSKGMGGGFFLYHAENQQVFVGLIIDLNYANPHISPFDEFQRLKHHPIIAETLSGGERITYGARAITKGGLNALPKLSFPGGMLVGCDAGTLNFSKIKGVHTAMKSGMIAADAILEALGTDAEEKGTTNFQQLFEQSWAYQELYNSRNFGPALHKFGPIVGGGYNWMEQKIFGGKPLLKLRDSKEDYACMEPASAHIKIDSPKPDGKLSFDKLSSVYISNTYHEEDQPCHLKLTDTSIPIKQNLPRFDEPAQRYCPAGVYEVVESDGEMQFQINGQNCIHCKTCDIKDPAQNITWRPPEGGGGPTYPNT